jgi:hypothetical protein
MTLNASDAFNVFNPAKNRRGDIGVRRWDIDFCGAQPQHYGDAASLAIQREEVACPANNKGTPAPNPLFGTRTMFNPRPVAGVGQVFVLE